MNLPKDYDLEYCLTINVHQAKRRYIFFLSLVGVLALLTLFYERQPNYVYDAVAIFSGISVCLGLLLYFNKLPHIRLVGFLICSSIFAHALAHLGELFYEQPNDAIAILITSLVWFAFGYSFSTNWTLLIEPYFMGYQYFSIDKGPLCLGCRKKG